MLIFKIIVLIFVVIIVYADDAGMLKNVYLLKTHESTQICTYLKKNNQKCSNI